MQQRWARRPEERCVGKVEVAMSDNSGQPRRRKITFRAESGLPDNAALKTFIAVTVTNSHSEFLFEIAKSKIYCRCSHTRGEEALNLSGITLAVCGEIGAI